MVFRHRLVVALAFFLAGGIFMAGKIAVSPGIALLACIFLFLLAVTGYLLAWRNNWLVILLLFLVVGFVLARISSNQINPELFEYTGHWVTLEGVVAQEADVRPDKVYYYLDLHRLILEREQRLISGRVLVRLPANGTVYSYGDFLRLHGMLTLPDEPGNPGEFNYRDYLARRGVGAILMVKDAKMAQRLGVGGNLFIRRLLLFKEKLLQINRETLPLDKAALVNGIVFGTQGEISRDTWQIFSETGIVHILSVSGMHVGLVLAGVLGVLVVFRVPLIYTAPVATIVLILYAILCGLGPAVTRATLMGLFFLWAHHLGRDRDWPTTLAFAALASLAWKPLSLYDIGFQLSFAATWGILYLGPVLNRFVKRFTWLPTWMRAVIWVSLSAQLATLPLVAWYYNIVSFVSLPANMVAAPLTGAILALGTAADILGFFSLYLAGLVNAATSLVLDIFMGLVCLVRILPGGVLYVATPPLFLVVGWYLLMFFFVFLSTSHGSRGVKAFLTKKRLLTAVFASGVFLLAVAWSARGMNQESLSMHLMDVGQGESILIQTPGGKNMLVDTGGWAGEFESGHGAGDRVIVPYLHRLGVRQLDVLVITHPHEDHAGGAKAVTRSFPVDLALVSPAGWPGNTEEELPPAYTGVLAYLSKKGTPVQVVGAGDSIRLDPQVQVHVLGPTRPLLRGTRSDANNGSVVLLLRYGEQGILLTGDIELEAQQWLLDSGVNLSATVLKVPHHGSQYLLPAFIKEVRPAMALISVGRNNRFGLPARETLDLLKKVGATTYRTDLDGAIILRTDGKHLWIKTGKLKKAA